MSRKQIITLCGSTRFPQAFEIANMHLSLLGYTVIGLGLYGHADSPMGSKFITGDGAGNNMVKHTLDQVHFNKIDLADAIYVINVGGYIGTSTALEIKYARNTNKDVYFMFTPPFARA